MLESFNFASIYSRSEESIRYLRQTQINTYATYSRLTLYLYDILLNISREKRLIWSNPLRLSSILYYFVRYPVVSNQIFSVLSSPHIPHCDVWYKFTTTLTIVITRIAITIAFILRVYAITERSIAAAFLLSTIGLLSIVFDMVQVSELSCTQTSNPLAFVITFISLIVFDIASTGLMIWKLAGAVRLNGGIRNMGQESAVGLVMRSGILYFIVITGIQMTAVILYFLPQGLYSMVLNEYTLIISSILLSRFLLDLRSMNTVRVRTERKHSATTINLTRRDSWKRKATVNLQKDLGAPSPYFTVL